MKRFAIAAALAAVIGLGTTGTASAQYVQTYRGVTPNGGLVIGNSASNWGAYQTNRTYISPYGGVRQQSYYNDIYGNQAGQVRGYNNYTGFYNRAYYQPGPFVNPYGAYNYNYSTFYGRRW